MQSILQYRRFGRQVEEQLERRQQAPSKPGSISSRSRPHELSSSHDPEKALNGTSDGKDQDPTSPRSTQRLKKESASSEGDSPTDLEKAERSNSLESVEPLPRQHSPYSPAEAEEDEQENGLGVSLSRATTRSNRTLGTRLGYALNGINVRDRTTNEGGDRLRQVFVVNFEGDDDPMNPHNWSRSQRTLSTIFIACIGAVVGLASSIDASILMSAAKEFHVSQVAESLATGIFLVGFGVGALFAGPVSETLGRNPVYIATLSLYMIFIMASGLAPNFGAQVAFRFLAGAFASTPLTCAGGSIADQWNSFERIITFPIFANAAFMGPILGPVIGGWVELGATKGELSWRWTEWITLALSGVVLGLVVLFQPETYAPVILKWKAAHLRKLTGDDRFCAELEIRKETFIHRLVRSLYRPFIMTAREPIIILVALYLSVIYIILFTFLDGYDYIFAEIHGLNAGLTGVCFVGIAVGLCVASALVPVVYVWAKRDIQKQKDQGVENPKLAPEFRLHYAMLGGSISIPVSLFWMGWTSDSNISLWSPLIASVFFGFGVLTVFISSYQYIIDSYEIYAASALASVTLLRYAVAGGMVVVGIPFYENLGVHYTLTVLGCISAALVPVPYVFYKYGPKIRAKSSYAILARSEGSVLISDR